MSRQAALDNIVIVMYCPQDVVNVGGVIRVMSNFGLGRLRLIEPAAWDSFRIEGIAHHTEAIINRVEHYSDLTAALADCSFVVGTTGRPRGTRRERLDPRTVAPAIMDTAQRGETVAILYGPEDDGLPNSALDLCHALLTIPTDPTNHSLNLAQAALVIAYELWLTAHEPETSKADTPLVEAMPAGTPPADQPPPTSKQESSVLAALQADTQLAAGSDREALFASLTDMLYALYPETTETRVEYAMGNLRAVILRAVPRADEARRLTHLFTHIARTLRDRK